MLTANQKFMNRLKKCLNDIPKGMGLHIRLNYSNNATFALSNKDELDNLFANGDLMIDSGVVDEFVKFSADRVYPNSECI